MKFSLSSLNAENLKKGLNYLKFNGVGGVVDQVRYKMTGPGLAYNNWYKEKHEADAEELDNQRNAELAYQPKVSIIVPVYMTPEFFLRSMIESVMRQSYQNWQLCIVDGSQADKAVGTKNAYEEDETDGEAFADRSRSADREAFADRSRSTDREAFADRSRSVDREDTRSVYESLYSKETEKIIREYMEKDERINYLLMEENLGISDNTNAAIDMAKGEYIAFLEHDDVLSDDALYCMVEALQEEHYDVLYSDEDKMSEDGTKFSDPAFKPDFSPNLIRCYNYIHRFLMVKKLTAIKVGCMHSEFDGGQAYDFILRLTEITDSIRHVPRVLYHYRINNSANANDHKKEFKNEMERKALMAYIRRQNLYATLGVSEIPGVNKINYETPGNPYISIIIPGGENWEMLDKTLRPLFELARYSNFEVIIVDQDGTNDVMLKYYHKMERIRRNIRVVVNRDADTLTELRNYGAKYAKGEYILFLDGNVEIDAPTAIGDMLGLCMQKDAAIVSGTLFNDNNTVYHEGYVVGVNGTHDNLYRGLRRKTLGYLRQNRMSRELSAVSASCMLVKREVYESVGGFDERFDSELSAVDFCLKARLKGLRVLCDADATWYFHRAYIYVPAARSKVKPTDSHQTEVEDNIITEVPENMASSDEVSNEENSSLAASENVENDKADEIFNLKGEKLFKFLWQDFIDAGDPYYNVNFARDGELFSLE